MTTQKTDYQTLAAELETILAALQRPGIQVDEAVKLYEQGLKLAAALEAHLQEAENTIRKLKLQHGAGDA